MAKVKLVQWYRRIPIRTKIFLWFLPLLIVTISLTGAYAFRTAANEIESKMQAEQESAAKMASDHLDYIARDATDIANYLFLTPEIQSLLLSSSARGEYVSNQNITDSINRLMVTRPYFQFLTIYSHRFAPIQFNNKGLSTAISFETYRELFDYDETLKKETIDSWSVETPTQSRRIFYGDDKTKVILTRVLKNSVNYKPEGVLLIGIDEKDIRASYAPANDSTEITIVNRDGIVLSNSKGQWIGEKAGDLDYFQARDGRRGSSLGVGVDKAEWVVGQETSTLTGWQVFVMRPRSELLSELNRITWTTVGIVAATILIGGFVSWAVAGWITKPIGDILFSMKRFQKGNFHEQVDVKASDEIGQLGAGYNIMVQRIKQLIDDVYAFEIKQKEAELKLLQSQMNPHFLYNTLNTIAWTAQKNNDRTVADMVYSLSSIFKTSLNKGKDFVPLKEEFQLLEHYLFLQKMRFQSHLTYELELDPDVAEAIVPKLLLQPLVENSIVHGIERLSDDPGFVSVRAFRQGDALEVEITDNGVGITQERMQSIVERMQAHGDRHDGSFALYNVSNRLRMAYGNAARLELQSTPGSGTRVFLHIPFKEK
ncbi:MAG TPA: sensor histidine kinase [Paenibacillus sp.]|nr:sensor histidine kinase [Paenibacillus sp.]